MEEEWITDVLENKTGLPDSPGPRALDEGQQSFDK